MFYLHLSWWDFTSLMRWKMNPEFYEILSHLTASSVASKHPQELLNPQQPFRDSSTPYYYSQRPLLYNQSSLPTRCCSGCVLFMQQQNFSLPWDTVSLLFALSSISEPTVSPTVSPQVLHKPSSLTQTGRLLIKEKAEQWKGWQNKNNPGILEKCVHKTHQYDSWDFYNFQWIKT